MHCLCWNCAPITGLRYSCTALPRPPHQGDPRHAGPGIPGAEGQPLRGRPLRRAALAVLLLSGRPCAISEVEKTIEVWGYQIGGPKPRKALADALAYEADRGWAHRVARGRYGTGHISVGSRYRILAFFH